MFGLKDLLSLVISAFIILPVVLLIRESGYLIVSWLFGVINPRVTIGTGPRIFKIGMIDIRKYYHLYSWFSYDGIKRKSNFAYVCIYAGPIIANLTVAFFINFSVAHGWGEEYKTFLDRFVFYAIYYVMFDIIPMITTNSKPNNGMIIYEMLRYGKRVDFNNEAFLPSTSEVEKEYQEYIEQLEEIKKERKEK
ncbi:hypothetical protein [Rummeliibacillus sp. TYF-LIM-RU47]|uniref:hypothetical protein n=1 Tax=Rummeliibacillus sp. TYF-LIM-RU47 TaxID=2608406 RepID=UPI001239890C|nr:hypothetical protein [Rummeliibacillus sp. TYF-LIM-RU47]